MRINSTITARILKALSIFGSIEMLTILCAVIRTKLVALWIGAAGVGVISLYNSTLDMLRSMLLPDVRQSSVREIATAPADKRAAICLATRRLGILVGAVAAILVAALSPVLSRITFGSDEYTWGFAVLSLTIFMNAVADARRAIFQGLERLKTLAKVSVGAAVVATATAIPLFYFFRMQAIVPVLLVFSLTTVLFMLSPSIPKPAVRPPKEEVRRIMRSTLKLGTYLTAAVATTFIADYLLRVYLNTSESLSTVGLFQAGNTIVKTYIGVIFTAIAMEYYPRLSANIKRTSFSQTVVAHQVSIVTWILMPVIVIFICADRLVVRLLYTESFLAVLPYISIAIIGTILRGASWCMAFVILAKGDGKAYILTEAVSAVAILALSIPAWHLWGFAGLGAAYVAQYLIYTLITSAVCRRRYGISLPTSIIRLILLALAVTAATLVLKLTFNWWLPLLLILPWLIPLTLKHLRK